MRKAINRFVVLPAVMLLVLSMTMLPAANAQYYYKGYADSTSSSYGGDWYSVGYSYAENGPDHVHVQARAEGPYGNYWANAQLSDSFVYTDSDHYNKVRITYFLRGRLMNILGATNNANVYLKVIDLTTNSELSNQLILSSSGNTYFQEDHMGESVVYLRQGHTYKVLLTMDLSCTAWWTQGGMTDFGSTEFDGKERAIVFKYDEVSWV